LVLHGDGAARDGVVDGRLARLQVVPGVVADVVGALGLVDAQQADGAAAVAQLDADVVAVDGAGPVGDAVGVDLAAEDADRGRVAVVRGGPDALGGGAGPEGEEAEGNEGAGAVHGCVVAVGQGVEVAVRAGPSVYLVCIHETTSGNRKKKGNSRQR